MHSVDQIEILRKKPKCPAVTLEVKMKKNIISVDFVLGLKVHRASWPDFTKDGFKIENWLSRKEKANMKRQPFYLVPKYEGKRNAEHDGVVAKGIVLIIIIIYLFCLYIYIYEPIYCGPSKTQNKLFGKMSFSQMPGEFLFRTWKKKF